MESLLNFAWVLVSVLVVCAGILHHRARRDRTHPRWLVVVALLAMAVLLFPVISLTDDLNPAIFASEDISRRNHLAALVHAPVAQQALLTASWMALLISCLVIVGFTRRRRERAHEHRGFVVVLPGRAPPSFA